MRGLVNPGVRCIRAPIDPYRQRASKTPVNMCHTAAQPERTATQPRAMSGYATWR